MIVYNFEILLFIQIPAKPWVKLVKRLARKSFTQLINILTLGKHSRFHVKNKRIHHVLVVIEGNVNTRCISKW